MKAEIKKAIEKRFFKGYPQHEYNCVDNIRINDLIEFVESQLEKEGEIKCPDCGSVDLRIYQTTKECDCLDCNKEWIENPNQKR